MTINVTLRSKTMNTLPNQETCQTLKNVISDHIATAGYEMRDLIWKLTYQPQKTSAELGFKELDEAQIAAVRNEIAHFYREIHPDWKFGIETPGTEEEKALWKALKGDPFAYSKVMFKIRDRSSWQGEIMDKLMGCLNSRYEKAQFGGIRQLGFSGREAQFLKGAVTEITAVLKQRTAQWREKQQKELAQQS